MRRLPQVSNALQPNANSLNASGHVSPQALYCLLSAARGVSYRKDRFEPAFESAAHTKKEDIRRAAAAAREALARVSGGVRIRRELLWDS